MDYVIGSVAALVTGNVTPSRPRLLKRALTPTKHQPSPNVTPKSEFVEDRSIFLSPSMQKKKAIVKKSPKRIFQNPDLETTDNGEGNLSTTSPKADKVKKHLKDQLEDSIGGNKSLPESKSPKKKGSNKSELILPEESTTRNVEQNSNESTPKKKKRKSNIVIEDVKIQSTEVENTVTENNEVAGKSPKKMKQWRKSIVDDDNNKENDNNDTKITEKSPNKQSNVSESTETNNIENANKEIPKKKNNKRKKKQKQQQQAANVTSESTENKANAENNPGTPKKKKNRKRKKSKSEQNEPATETALPEEPNNDELEVQQNTDEPEVPSKKSKPTVNPNAITEKESDSEHESDNEIESENEEINKKVFESEQAADDDSSDEEDDEEEKAKTEKPKKEKADKKKEVKEKGEINTEAEIKRTLFVGNVPFSAKCKKEIKKIFSKHGQIETIRIRTVPVKDGRYTPKLAVIKNELHPERTTVNVYIKYAAEDSVTQALTENNTVLNEHHLRVSRSAHTGAEHDPKCSIFVGNLPFAMEDEALRQKFENCGEIDSVRIIRDKKTNAGKGFGYVNFTSKDGVELALALTEEDLTIKNRIIRVKRCTLLTNKQKQSSDNKVGLKKQFNQRINQGGPKNNKFGQRDNQGGQRGNQSGQRGNQFAQRGNQGGPRSNQGGPRGNQGGPRGNQGGPRGNQFGQRGNQFGQRGDQAGQRWNQGGQRGDQGGQKFGAKDAEARDGAHRRIMQKRKNHDGTGGDGPPNKKQKNINQPNKEKKTRKEFVGMTAEKKKKHKFDKGQKKKKALSEILTK